MPGMGFFVRCETDGHAVVGFDPCQFAPFLIQRIDRDVWRHLHADGRSALLLPFFLHRTQDAQRGGFDGADYAQPVAMGAGYG
jgi:hypothetical protein